MGKKDTPTSSISKFNTRSIVYSIIIIGLDFISFRCSVILIDDYGAKEIIHLLVSFIILFIPLAGLIVALAFFVYSLEKVLRGKREFHVTTIGSLFNLLALILSFLVLFIAYSASGLKAKYLTYRAEKENNPEICERARFSTNKDICYKDIAISFEDEDICLGIESDHFKTTCFNKIEILSEKSDACSDVAQIILSLQWMAKKVKDPDVLESISPAALQPYVDNCYFQWALVTGDSSHCQKVELEHYKRICDEYFE